MKFSEQIMKISERPNGRLSQKERKLIEEYKFSPECPPGNVLAALDAAPKLDFHDKYYRGCWLNREELIKIILAEEDCYDLHEGFFDYYLVETRLIGEIDDWVNEEDSKLWFQYDGEKYCQIEEPECFRQIVSFT